jgi:hypothetical protein
VTVVAPDKLLIVKPTLIRVIGWICILFFLFGTIGAWRAGAHKPALIFLVFVGLGVFLVLFSGTLEMTSEIIIFHTYLKRIVFWGENKRLVGMGPYYWQGADRKDMLLLVATQIDKLGLTVQQSEKAMFRRSKNTRVRA